MSAIPVPKMRLAVGFTLVELLVVIGIIGVLVGILVPALSSARQAAQSIQCQANLRQLGMSILLYVNDNKGRGNGMTPVTYPLFFPGGPASNYYWNGAQIASGPDISHVTFTNQPEGLLYPYLKKSGVFFCPTMEPYNLDWAPFEGLSGFIRTHYAGNGQVAVVNLGRLSQLRNSAETFMFADAVCICDPSVVGNSGGPATATPGLFCPNSTMSCAVQGGPTGTTNVARSTGNNSVSFHGRHRGRGNVVWYDGHVSSELARVVPDGVLTDASAFNGGGGNKPAWSAQSIALMKAQRIGILSPVAIDASAGGSFASFKAWGQANNVDYYYWVNKTSRQ